MARQPIPPWKRRQYNRTHYDKHKDELLAGWRIKNRRKRSENRDFVLDYLSTHPCVDCGEADPVVLEFDHRDPSLKSFAISASKNSTKSLDRIREEIAKCDVRCANCHRRRTHMEQHWRSRREKADEVAMPLLALLE